MTAHVLDEIAAYIKPGLTTRQVDEFAGECIRAHGGKSAFLGYRKYPCNTCISVNEEVVHGMGSERELLFGDIVSLDVGVAYNGFVGDTARTVAVGGCGVLAQRLMDVTERALYQGIAAAVSGNRVTDISRAVQNYVEGNGFSVVREFVGHGVGRAMHEEPQVPNFVDRKMNDKLRAGMTIAIEPMVNAGQAAVKILKDGWTVVSQDGSLSAHFEHTVLITDGEPEILTWPEKKPFALKVA
jgi:methionyl aminopeptidase